MQQKASAMRAPLTERSPGILRRARERKASLGKPASSRARDRLQAEYPSTQTGGDGAKESGQTEAQAPSIVHQDFPIAGAPPRSIRHRLHDAQLSRKSSRHTA